MKYINYIIIFALVLVEALPQKHEHEVEIRVNGNQIQTRMETMARFLELILQRLNMSTSLTTVNPNTADCSEQCKLDDSCTSGFWRNSTDSNCELNYDKHTIISFVPEKLYYCKDCRTNISSVLEGEDYGVINLVNATLNKITDASSFANDENVPSNAVDGDANTKFSTEALLAKGEQWFMVDLGERFLVAQIKIQVEDTLLSKNRGGYLEVCLTDEFERSVNPCNQDTEILTINGRLRSSIVVFFATKVIMGRYIVLQKLKPKEVLEIVELEIQVVLPVMSYICAKCAEQANTTCYTSDLTPKCQCNEKNQFPIDRDALHGCRDPCEAFSLENAVCTPVDFENCDCTCREGSYYPVEEDACKGCKDPCIGFEDRNSICNPVDAENYNCECKTGFYPIFDNPCLGCRDPCSSFKARNSICTPVDSENYNCDCKPGFHPIFKNACIGCEDPCFNITLENASCTSNDFEYHECLCNEGYYPIGGNPCNDCSNPCEAFSLENAVCTPVDFENFNCSCREGSYYPVEEDACGGCKDPCIGFKNINSICHPVDAENYNCECKTGFYPMFDNPCLGCRDPCSSFKAINSICTSVDFENYNCDCKSGFHPIFKNACSGCKDPCQSIKPGNASCTSIDFEKYECVCNAHYIPIARTPCNGCITKCTKTGSIKSPNYPNNYPHYYSNYWIVQASSGCKVKITFQTFKTENKNDVLKIHDGTTSSSNIVAELSGSIIPDPIYSKNNGFYLQFSTDVSESYVGFSILWEEVPQ